MSSLMQKFMARKNIAEDPSLSSKQREEFEQAVLWAPEPAAAVTKNPVRKGLADYVIRLLPNHPNQENAFNVVYSHSYFNNNDPKSSVNLDCLLNYGLTEDDCPICRMQAAAVSDHFDKGGDGKNMDLFVKGMKSKRTTFAWVYVREDQYRPDNIGKVYLMEVKKAVLELIAKHQDVELLTKMRKQDQICEIVDIEAGGDVLMIANYNADQFDRYNESSVINIKTPVVESEPDLEAILGEIKDLTDVDLRYFNKYFRVGKTAEELEKAYSRGKITQRFSPAIESLVLGHAVSQRSSNTAPQTAAPQTTAPQQQAPQQEAAPTSTLYRGPSGGTQQAAPQQTTQQGTTDVTFDDFDDDIPF